jgi:hypothetical protein
MATFVQRTLGAALLRTATYEEVEADRSATTQAVIIVVLSSLATGVGALDALRAQPASFASLSAIALVLWAAWALLTLQIGTRIIPGPRTDADYGQLLRTLGFAASPGILRAAGIIPGIGGIVFAVTSIWMLMAMIVAVRQALDYTSTARAFAVCAIGWALTVAMAIGVGVFWATPVH